MRRVIGIIVWQAHSVADRISAAAALQPLPPCCATALAASCASLQIPNAPLAGTSLTDTCRHQTLPLVCRRLCEIANSPQLTAAVELELADGERALPRLQSLCSWLQAGAAARVRRLSLAFLKGWISLEADHAVAACLDACAAAGPHLEHLCVSGGAPDVVVDALRGLRGLRTIRLVSPRINDFPVDDQVQGLTRLEQLVSSRRTERCARAWGGGGGGCMAAAARAPHGRRRQTPACRGATILRLRCVRCLNRPRRPPPALQWLVNVELMCEFARLPPSLTLLHLDDTYEGCYVGDEVRMDGRMLPSAACTQVSKAAAACEPSAAASTAAAAVRRGLRSLPMTVAPPPPTHHPHTHTPHTPHTHTPLLQVSSLTGLQALGLIRYGPLELEGYTVLPSLTRLRRLALASVKHLPPSLPTLTNLEALSVDDSWSLTDEATAGALLLEALPRLSRLTHLALTTLPGLDGPPAVLANMTQLRSFFWWAPAARLPPGPWLAGLTRMGMAAGELLASLPLLAAAATRLERLVALGRGSLEDCEALVEAAEAMPTVRLLELDVAPTLDHPEEHASERFRRIQQAIFGGAVTDVQRTPRLRVRCLPPRYIFDRSFAAEVCLSEPD